MSGTPPKLEPTWVRVEGSTLRQGDYLPGCLVPVYPKDFATRNDAEQKIPVHEYDVIVLTQSCDLDNKKIRLVATCPVYSITEFEAQNPKFKQKGKWNDVLKGRFEGLHILASPNDPYNNREALVVDFREVYSLPFDYLEQRAGQVNPRWRLRPQFVEKLSQAFGLYFMRVGLPPYILEF